MTKGARLRPSSKRIRHGSERFRQETFTRGLCAQLADEMKLYYVYAIRCFDGTFYVGMTNNVDRRFWEHQHETVPTAYTHGRGPLLLVHVSEFYWVNDAIAFEKKFKGWSHPKKRAFIDGDYDAMRRYGRGKDRKR